MANSTVYPYGANGTLPEGVSLINDLTTGGADKALAAQQGVVLKGLIDASDAKWTAMSDDEKMELNGKTLRQIILSFTGDVYDSMNLYGVKAVTSVLAVYDDKTSEYVTDYSLTGIVKAGTRVFTATYQKLKASASVTVLEREATLSSISATSSQSSVSMYVSLDDIRKLLTVTKTYSDETTELTDDYTLSGTPAEGSFTVTVTYNGDNTKTTTVSFTGVNDYSYLPDSLESMVDFQDYADGYTGDIVDSISGKTVTINGATLSDIYSKTSFGGVHNHVFIMSKWMQNAATKAPYLSIPGIMPALPLTIEFYGRIRAPYANGSQTINAMSSSMYGFLNFKVSSSSSNQYSISTSSGGEIKVHGPAAVPSLTTSGANIQYYDSSNTSVTAFSHIVVSIASKVVRVFVNGTKIYDGTPNTSSASGGADFLLFSSPTSLAADICMTRIYSKVLTDQEVTRNYTNCTHVYGTNITA